MRKLIILAALLLPSMAAAQEATSTSTSQAGNSTNVQVMAGTTLQPAATSVDHSGYVYGTPSAASSIISGANNCLVATGGGIAGGPIAFNFAQGKEDKGCSRVRNAAALKGLGYPREAMVLMCQDQTVADAFYAANALACPGTDRKRYGGADYAVLAGRE
jgi:hypothetical protein